jgi:hypothetical protein
MKERKLTHKQLLEVVHYIPSNGLFIRIQSSTRHRAGEVMGTLRNGYICIGVGGKQYYAHRLAIFYMTGMWPKEGVDHINHIKTDNTWANLREATGYDNAQNITLSSRNTSGFNGVTFCKERNKWQAQIKANGKSMILGQFHNIADAIKCRKQANIKYGFHENHGYLVETMKIDGEG